jgi:quercetin dioxygenase-like cupin family protein
VRQWNLTEIEAPGGTVSPVVVDSQDEGRAVLVALEPGQELGEHQVKERAYVLVVAGRAQVQANGTSVECGPGTLLAFDPDERRTLASAEGARILMLLTPWPGEGHYRGGGEDAPAAGGS